MNPAIASQFIAAGRFVQSKLGETVTLAGVSYPCVAGSALSGALDFVQGGALDMQHIPVCVLKDDLAVQPAVNTLAVFRGVSLRVKSVDDDGTNWQISLVQEFA
jgi:hypothetical protein